MLDEVELQVEGPGAARDRRGGQPAGVDVEGDLSPVVEQGRPREPDLADDLGPHVHAVAGVGPSPRLEAAATRAMNQSAASSWFFLSGSATVGVRDRPGRLAVCEVVLRIAGSVVSFRECEGGGRLLIAVEKSSVEQPVVAQT